MLDGILDLATCHRALLLADAPLSQLRETVPEPDCHCCGCNSRNGTRQLSENAPGRNDDVNPEGERKREKRQLGNGRRQTMEIFAVLAAPDDAVLGTGGNQ